MAEHSARSGGELREPDWDVFLAADEIADRIVRKDASQLGGAIAEDYRQHLKRVCERMASTGDFRGEDGAVCEARIWGYFNNGPRRELARICEDAARHEELDHERHEKLHDTPAWEPGDAPEDRGRKDRDALKALLDWACGLERSVAISAIARARGASWTALAEVLGKKRNTLVQNLLRASRKAPAHMLREAGFLLPVPGVRPRGRNDPEIVRTAVRVVDAIARNADSTGGRRGARHIRGGGPVCRTVPTRPGQRWERPPRGVEP